MNINGLPSELLSNILYLSDNSRTHEVCHYWRNISNENARFFMQDSTLPQGKEHVIMTRMLIIFERIRAQEVCVQRFFPGRACWLDLRRMGQHHTSKIHCLSNDSYIDMAEKIMSHLSKITHIAEAGQLRSRLLEYMKCPVIAAVCGSTPALKSILDRGEMNPLELIQAAYVMCGRGDFEMIKWFVCSGKVNIPDPSNRDFNHRIVLTLLGKGRHDIINYLLSFHPLEGPPERKRLKEDSDEERLIDACREGNIHQVTSLIEETVDVNYRDIWDLSPIDYCLIFNHEICLELLHADQRISDQTFRRMAGLITVLVNL